MKRKYRLAVLQSHPIQYFAPLFRRLSAEDDIDLKVLYCSRQGVNEYADDGFGQKVKWDVPLLEGYDHTFLPNLRREDRVGDFFSLCNVAVVKDLLLGRYDALWVHGHNYGTHMLAILTARLLRIPVMMRCESHLKLQRSPLKRALRRPLMTIFYRQLCAACLPIGTLNREFYRFHRVGSHRLFLVPYTVDNAFFKEATARYRGLEDDVRKEAGLPQDKPLILFASKFIARKRPMDLLQAYHKLRHEGADAALVLVGSGEGEQALREYVQSHNVPDVYFLGFRNQTELPKFYAVADVFVLPSEDEPWGLIINEVMCAGVPIVATSEIGAVQDLVKHGDNGFVYKATDIDSLASHLKVLVDDAELRKRMGRRSVEIIDEWDFESCTRGINRALGSLRR